MVSRYHLFSVVVSAGRNKTLLPDLKQHPWTCSCAMVYLYRFSCLFHEKMFKFLLWSVTYKIFFCERSETLKNTYRAEVDPV